MFEAASPSTIIDVADVFRLIEPRITGGAGLGGGSLGGGGRVGGILNGAI